MNRTTDPTRQRRVGSSESQRLTLQLRNVIERSPFYQRKFGLSPNSSPPTATDLHALPFTMREELLGDQFDHPPFGSYLAAEPRRIARVHRTSGTSGRALMIALSAQDATRAVAHGAACFRSAGVRPDDLIIHCLSYCLWSGGVTDHLALEAAGAGVVPFGAGNTSELVDTIINLKPTGIHCTPSYLLRIQERLFERTGGVPASLGLRIGLFGGEPGLQDPVFRRRIESTWGFIAADSNYGMSEVLSMFGAECEARSGLHFLANDILHAELRHTESDNTIPIQPGATGELVLTHLARDCQPLIRYRSGDLIEITGLDRCTCGRSDFRFLVRGRADDMLVIRGVNIYLSSVASALNAFGTETTGEFQVIVNRHNPITECRIRLELASAARPETARQIESALQKILRITPRLECVPPGTLPRTQGKSRRIERSL